MADRAHGRESVSPRDLLRRPGDRYVRDRIPVGWEVEPVEANPRNDDGSGEEEGQEARYEQTSPLEDGVVGAPGARAEPAEPGGEQCEDQHADDVEHDWPHRTRLKWDPSHAVMPRISCRPRPARARLAYREETF